MKIEEISENNIIYKIKRNETLKDIAKKFNTTEELIRQENEIEEIEEGDVVLIAEKNRAVYVVKPLDNLSSVANKFNVTKEYIINKNKLLSERLFIGQKLII